MTDFVIAIAFASGALTGFLLGVIRCISIGDQMRCEQIRAEIDEKSRMFLRPHPYSEDKTAWVFFNPHRGYGESWIILPNRMGVEDAIRHEQKGAPLPGGGVYYLNGGKRTWIDTGDYVEEAA